MVYFIERFLSEVRHLVVLSNRNQPRDDGLSLLVEKPWAGSFADYWPCLDNNSIFPRLYVEIPLSEGKPHEYFFYWTMMLSIKFLEKLAVDGPIFNPPRSIILYVLELMF
uniref:Uncharacterized protein n=1 Tax=Cucumis melo TaxID=3656 RepID=A0A9I9EIL0_CUCME